MRVSEERLNRCAVQGTEFERLFVSRAEALGKHCEYGTQQDDWYKHIDIWVDGHGVDVKGSRHLETIWLEHTNTRGNKGWLRGEATYIAMHVAELDLFSIYLREELLEFVEQNTKGETTDKREYFKYYTRKRWGKLDRVVKVRYDDIKHLERATI